MKTYLITGGAGFIGSNFILFLLKKYEDIEIINLDKLTYAGNLENLKEAANDGRYTFVQGDICDRELVSRLFRMNEIHYVVNFAAESHVDRSIETPELFVRSNVLGTVNLLNCAKADWELEDGWKRGVKFLQVSTDEVYGSLEETGYFTEETPLAPRSPYSSSKAGADLMVKAYCDTFNMPVNITRCSNNYGKFQFSEKLIPKLINNCLTHKPLTLYGDGLNIRDWLYVEDHCSAIDLVINKGSMGEVYNIGGHNECSNISIAKIIIKYLNENYDKQITEALIEYVEDRKGHDRRYGIDPRKITEELGWKSGVSFHEGLIETIDWYVERHKSLARS